MNAKTTAPQECRTCGREFDEPTGTGSHGWDNPNVWCSPECQETEADEAYDAGKYRGSYRTDPRRPETAQRPQS